MYEFVVALLKLTVVWNTLFLATQTQRRTGKVWWNWNSAEVVLADFCRILVSCRLPETNNTVRPTHCSLRPKPGYEWDINQQRGPHIPQVTSFSRRAKVVNIVTYNQWTEKGSQWLTFTCARPCSRCFIVSATLFDLHNSPMRWRMLSSPFTGENAETRRT